MGRELTRLDERRYIGKSEEYEEYTPRPPIVRIWKNTSNKPYFIKNPIWDGSMHAKRRILPGEYHVIDEQRGEISMSDDEIGLFYTKKPGRKPEKSTGVDKRKGSGYNED